MAVSCRLATDHPTRRLAIEMERTDAAGSFRVVGLTSSELVALASAQLSDVDWKDVFAVRVAPQSMEREAGRTVDLPPMLGHYAVDHTAVRFVPRYPIEPGVRYRATLSLVNLRAAICGMAVELDPISEEFTVPALPRRPVAAVQQIYPTVHTLPQNHLKFYIHFSHPMGRGRAYDSVRLLDASGHPVRLPFLELEHELWDATGTRFTLFFDPGRVKRELVPNRELGPVLEPGREYVLEISSDWLDATGLPLREPYRKRFRVGPADYTSPDPDKWQLEVPAAASMEPLTVRFLEPLDHALLQRLVWVNDVNGEALAGTASVLAAERAWQFTPHRPWQRGVLTLVAQKTLEDLAGNSIARAFEVDLFPLVERRLELETAARTFEIR